MVDRPQEHDPMDRPSPEDIEAFLDLCDALEDPMSHRDPNRWQALSEARTEVMTNMVNDIVADDPSVGTVIGFDPHSGHLLMLINWQLVLDIAHKQGPSEFALVTAENMAPTELVRD